MFLRFLTLGLISCVVVLSEDKDYDRDAEDVDYRRDAEDAKDAEELIEKLKASENANSDLPKDEEYEDLRAELLAYHDALRSLTSESETRRSMKSTPCWSYGGICIEERFCRGFHFLTEIPGCKDKLEVCCFTWNKFRTRDMTEFGINNLALPWSIQKEVGGMGVIEHDPDQLKEVKKERKRLFVAKKMTAIPNVEDKFAVYRVQTTEKQAKAESKENVHSLEPVLFDLGSDENKGKKAILASKRALLEVANNDNNDIPIALVIKTGKK